MSRVLGVFSGKGGVGKTTLVSNLGASLSNVLKKNIVIFDNNIHTSHLGLHFGLYEDLPVTIREVLKRKMPITQAIYIHPNTGIRLIPAPIDGSGINITKEQYISLTNQIKGNYDLVIVDCAPGLGKEVISPMYAIDEAIVISTPDIASLADAMKTIEILKKLKKKVLGIVINRYRNQKYELTPQEITSTTNYPVLGIIPEDEKVPDSISRGMPVVLSFPHSGSSIAFKKLAASLVNETYHEEGLLERLKSMFLPKPPRKETRTVMKQEPIMQKEVSDTAEMQSQLLDEIKSELKKELKEKIKKRLKEKMYVK